MDRKAFCRSDESRGPGREELHVGRSTAQRMNDVEEKVDCINDKMKEMMQAMNALYDLLEKKGSEKRERKRIYGFSPDGTSCNDGTPMKQ